MSPSQTAGYNHHRFFRLITFGCKVNQCDSVGLAQGLLALGWQPAGPQDAPQAVVVNTCTVTRRADQQARQAIRRLARDAPGAAIWVTGCYAQRAPAELASLPGVAGVAGNREKPRLPAWVAGQPSTAGPRPEAPAPADFAFHPWPSPAFSGHSRPRLKIQEGCNHACTYCIVPQVRGPSRSWPPAAVMAALEALAAQGVQEVVLTGVDLGQYGRDLTPATDLAGLLRQLKSRLWPLRLRLSSLEPQEATPGLLEVLSGWEAFCPHFHLPLQSGAGPVLAAMGRPYGPDYLAGLMAAIHQRFPDAALGLDLLAGFPGETEADFAATVHLLRSMPATYVHVFPFSPRPGTPAAALKPLPHGVVKERAQILRALGQAKKQAFLQSQAGQVREVLVEGAAETAGWLKGLSDNYLRVALPGPPAWIRRRVLVRLTEVRGETLRGEALST